MSTPYFVYNVSHCKSTIRSASGQLRVLGVFDTAQQAEAHVDRLAAVWPDLEIRLSPTKSWRILSQEPMTLEDQSERLGHLLVKYREERQKVFDETLARAAARQSAEDFDKTSKNSDKPQVVEFVPEQHEFYKGLVPVLPPDLQVPRQTYVGIAVIPDVLKSGLPLSSHEPAFQIIAVSDNEADIHKALEDFANRPLIDHVESLYKSIPMACVSMYEFIRPAYIMKIPTIHESRVPQLQELKDAFHVHQINKDGGPSNDGP